MLVNGGKILSGEYAATLQRWTDELPRFFPEETNEHATWTPKNALDCFQNFDHRPRMAIEMALELSTIILELEAEGERYGNKQLYAHQMGHLKWLVLSLLNGGTSYVIEGAPGTGKTMIGGFLLMAATRLQMRGILDKSVLCTTYRPFTISQQALSRSQRIERIRGSRSHEAKYEWKYLQSILGADENNDDLALWRSFEKSAQTTGNIERIMTNVRELFTKMMPEKDEEALEKALGDAELILTRQCALVSDIGDDLMLLPFPKVIEDETPWKGMSGDLGIGVPEPYFEHKLVHGRREAGANVKTGRLTADESAAVILTTDKSVFNVISQVRDMLSDVDIVIVDEGEVPATAYQEAILTARREQGADDTHPPLVFIESALSTTNGLGARPHADAYSLRLTIPEAMDLGILSDVAIHHFPPSDEALFSSDTEEALDQMIDMHFTTFDLPKELNQHQPYECHTVIVVDASAVDATVLRLREEYEKRKLPGTIVPFKGNTTYPKSDRVLLWMMEEEFDEGQRPHAKILVATPCMVLDALSITGLENITIATAKGVGSETLERIFGRLQHSGLHHTRGDRYRGYFIQGLYQETIPEATLLSFLNRTANLELSSTEDGIVQLVPLQTIHSTRGKIMDQELIGKKRMKMQEYPLTTEALQQRREAKGTKLQKKESLDETLEHLLREPQPVADLSKIRQEPVWNELSEIADHPLMDWSKNEFRIAFIDIMLEKLFENGLPSFMREERKFWEVSFRQELQSVHQNGPSACIACVLSVLEKAVEKANKHNRFSVPRNIVMGKTRVTVDAKDRLPTHGERNADDQTDEESDELSDERLDVNTVKRLAEALDVKKQSKKPRHSLT